MKNYTNEDKICPHCGGDISGHCCSEVVVYWCDNCGSNDRNVKPNINITTK
jgi:formamidopyrimidine-DNA glycosylase